MRASLFFLSWLLVCLSLGQSPLVSPLPPGMQEGINITGPQSATLVFYAPGKPYVYLKGDHNNWQQNAAAVMNISPDGLYHWKEITSLTSSQEYRYQYVAGPNNLLCADPYAEKVLDPWHDQWINPAVYPNLTPYPNQTSFPVSVFQLSGSNFNWTDGSFVRPQRNKLCIYELLVRDFSLERSFQEVINKMDYLQELGINAIELMPITEFDGNESWGYNPNFWFAPDKYYGPANKLRELVNEAHSRGIAVILDMVFNHSWGLNPQVRMYNEANDGFGAVTADNPWLNTIATHDYNVGTDYNHESQDTRKWVKRAMDHWRMEYHIDGYRLDLSKGFTQNNTLGDLSAWNAYDQSRVDILMDYANHVWSQDPEFYMILEHLADNPEEVVLANAGFLMWGPMNYSYAEAAMGYSSDLSWASYQQRGFNYANLIAYMESHDEERIMWKCRQYGNSSGSYQIQDENTALERMALCNAFYLTLPGPKMIWQFGELGYDISINDCGNGTIDPGCRTANKPVLWEYYDDPERKALYDVVAAINHLRNSTEVVHTWNYDHSLDGYQKRIRLFGSDMSLVVIGNFNVVAGSMVPQFPHTGTWYDYLSGETIDITDLNASVSLAPGEFHIFTDVQVQLPGAGTGNLSGCTDADATNYNTNAQTDDGSCLYRITFNVSTPGLNVDPAGIHIAGNFQGWSPSGSALVEVSGDLWQYQLDLPPGQILEYKYINGNTWGQDEAVPGACGVPNGLGGFNRSITSQSSPQFVATHCFGSCEPCPGAAPQVAITFRVDLSEVQASTNGVHIAGNFQGWSPGSTPMTEESGNIWSYTGTFDPGEVIEYKFVNGITWGEDESVPAECALGLNRFFIAGNTDAILPIVCFGNCNACVACQGDFNGDGMRNVGDLLQLLNEAGCVFGCATDLSGDGPVNSADLILFLSIFGSNCP